MPFCIVHDCWNTIGHYFPKDETLRNTWLMAVKQYNSTRIASDSIVCLEHFTADDYAKGDYVGKRPLSKNAIPSVFSWNQISNLPTGKKGLDYSDSKRDSEQKTLERKLSVQPSSISSLPHHYKKRITHKTVASQTQNKPLLSHLKFTNKPTYIIFYTGLESHEKFCYVYHTLGPTVDHLGHQAASVPLEDQFFLTLMKLRRNTPDIELALFFNISMKIVQNIIISWIPFMATEWSELNTWPSKNLVNYYYNKEITDLMQKCHEKDSVDPEFSQMDSQVVGDCSNQEGFSLHVEKLIGKTKMYEILNHKLKGYCEPFEREIHFVCAMLCHYRQIVL